MNAHSDDNNPNKVSSEKKSTEDSCAFRGKSDPAWGILHIKKREKLMCTLVCIVFSLLEEVAYT